MSSPLGNVYSVALLNGLLHLVNDIYLRLIERPQITIWVAIWPAEGKAAQSDRWERRDEGVGFSCKVGRSDVVVSGLEEQALKLLSVCFTSLGAKGRQGEALSISGTHTSCVTYARILPLCQHLHRLLPTPANYHFTFCWVRYQDMPSH